MAFAAILFGLLLAAFTEVGWIFREKGSEPLNSLITYSDSALFDQLIPSLRSKRSEEKQSMFGRT